EERDVGVRKMELPPDGLEDGRDRIAIADAERIDQAHHDGDVPALGQRSGLQWPGLLARRDHGGRVGLYVVHGFCLAQPDSGALCEIASCRLPAELRPPQISNAGSPCAPSSRRHSVTPM